MGAIRRTQCRVCGAPREEKTTMPLCLDHRREYERTKATMARRRRGIPSMSEHVEARKRNATSSAQRHEQKRVERLKREVAEGRRICTTPGCGGKVGTIYGRLCEPCLFQKREAHQALMIQVMADAGERRRKKKSAKSTAPKVPKPPKPKQKQKPRMIPQRSKPVEVPCFIGPEYIERLEPVVVDRPIVRYRSPGIIAEEEERERSWAAWFEARGL
jgi:hypothetical protein